MELFDEVIDQLIETNKKLINNKIDIKTAQTVISGTQVLINAAKLQLEVYKVNKKVYKLTNVDDSFKHNDTKRLISECKEIAKHAEKMNEIGDNFDTVTDKRPFDLNREH
jgi:uncharacterized metal-binding protein